MEEKKTKIISLWVDFSLSVLACLTVVIFTLFAKSPIGDLNQLVNIVFDFLKNNLFIITLFIVLLFIILRLKIAINKTVEYKVKKQRENNKLIKGDRKWKQN